MKRAKYIFCIALLFSVASTQSMAQRIYDVLDYFPLRITEGVNLLPAPSLSYSPETDWSFGLALVLTKQDKDSEFVSTSAQLDLKYTLNHQKIIDLDYYRVDRSERFIFFGSNSFYDYTDTYFSQKNPGDYSSIRFTKIEFDNKAYYKIYEDWRLGLIHRIQIIKMPEEVQNSLIYKDQPTGYQGGFTHGIGFGILNDQRTNTINPAIGASLLNLNVTSFNRITGSEFTFTRFDFDFRRYFKFFSKNILAIQTVAIFNIGEPPFKLAGNIGGSRILRGYHNSKYFDRQMVAMQAELRAPVYNRIGIAAFLGIASVGTTISSTFFESPKPAGGLGLRFQIDKNSRGNLRFDVATGLDGLAYYFSYGEAF